MSSRHLSETERNRVLLLHGGGMSHRAIAHRLNCSPQTISNLITLFEETGSMHERPRPGRPPSIQPRNANRVVSLLRRRPSATASALSHTLRMMGLGRPSPRTVQRFRHAHAFHPVHPISTITLLPCHRQQRLAWCHHHRNNTFKHTVFSDEKPLRIDNTGQVFWIQDDMPHPTTVPRSKYIQGMVWGAVWYNGRSDLWFLSPGQTINATVYQGILNTHLLPVFPRRHYFLQDNATSHIDRTTTAWLTAHEIPFYNDFPAKSPDLNAIEYVWSWMANYINQRRPSTAAQLRRLTREAWYAIPQETIRRYIDHVHHLMAAVIESGGGHAGDEPED